MAITTSFSEVQSRYNPRYWGTIDEFEAYHLRQLAERLPDTNYYTNRDGVQVIIPPINHHPELQEYEVWSEGYAATGESGTAQLMGRVKARNFAQACHIVMCESFLQQVDRENHPDHKEYTTPGRWDYDPTRLSYWACRLYWSEELAKKSFG